MRKSLSEFFRSNTQVVQEDDERESDNVDDIHSLEERILQKGMFFSGQVMVNNKLTHKKKTFPPNNKRQTYPIFDEMDEIDEVDDAGRGGGGGGGEKRKGNIFWTKLKNSFQKKNNQTTTSSPTVHIHGKKTQSTNLQSLDNQFNGPSTNEFPPPAAYLPAVVGVRRRSRSRTSSFGSDSAASDADAICGSMRLDPNDADLIQGKYRVVDGLGLGGYGVVVKVEDCSTYPRNVYAMKVIPKKQITMKKTSREQLELEIEAMSSMDSPFIIKCHDTFETDLSNIFIFEIVGGGDLFHHLKEAVMNRGSEAPLTHRESCTILAELYLALEHMHSRGFIHRDIKIENIMLDLNGHIKLIDFGLSTHIADSIQPLSRGGGLIYMAPELLADKIGGRHTDWWSYGIVAYELFTGYSPWSSLHNNDIIAREILTMPIQIPSFLWGTDIEEFLNSLLIIDYRLRIGTTSDQEITELHFFHDINWDKMSKLEYPPAFSELEEEDCISHEQKSLAMRQYDELMKPSID